MRNSARRGGGADIAAAPPGVLDIGVQPRRPALQRGGRRVTVLVRVAKCSTGAVKRLQAG